LDLLAQDENLTEQQSEIITRIEKNVRILSKLNRNLLLLARIENEQVDKTGQTNISAVVDETCSALEEEIKMKGLTLSLSLLPDVPVISNEHLVHSLVANLITNAIRYNIPRGRIDIQLGNDRFEITNTGQGHSLDESRIFERFYNSKGAGGSGLGLAIAKKICLTLGYELNYRFSMPDHHTFTVKFT
jgi:signal transduction histidine kinase